jgi:hypothetical protein
MAAAPYRTFNSNVRAKSLQRIGVKNITAAGALTRKANAGRINTVNSAAGIALTLPAATGSGDEYELIVGTTVTSSALTVSVVGNDAMFGNAILSQDAADTAVMFEAAADSDRISMNGSTTGGLKGARIKLIDIAADTWYVHVVSAATGTEATPFLTGQVS